MRKSDREEKAFFRVRKRLYCENGQWYFQTREAIRGPFKSEHEAEVELRLYIDTMEFVQESDPQQRSNIDWSNISVVDDDKLTPGELSSGS